MSNQVKVNISKMEPEPIDNENKVEIVIENVVCSFDVKSNLNLQHIANVAKNVVYRKKNQRQSYISPVL